MNMIRAWVFGAAAFAASVAVISYLLEKWQGRLPLREFSGATQAYRNPETTEKRGQFKPPVACSVEPAPQADSEASKFFRDV